MLSTESLSFIECIHVRQLETAECTYTLNNVKKQAYIECKNKKISEKV